MVISLMGWLWKLFWLSLWLGIEVWAYDDKKTYEKVNNLSFILQSLPSLAVSAMIAFLPDFITALIK